MTDIETQASLLLDSCPARKGVPLTYDVSRAHAIEALCRAIEQHDAFRQEVSDALEDVRGNTVWGVHPKLWRFIIAKPDPLVEALNDLYPGDASSRNPKYAADLRAALAARGLKIVEVE